MLMTPLEAVLVLAVVWGSLFLFLWLRGIIHDHRNRKDSK